MVEQRFQEQAAEEIKKLREMIEIQKHGREEDDDGRPPLEKMSDEERLRRLRELKS